MSSLFPMKIGEKIKIAIKLLFSGKKKKWGFLSIIVILLLVFSLLKFSYLKKREMLAVVNGYPVTVEDVAVKVKNSPEFYREYIRENPQVLLEDYINQVLLYQRAGRYRRKYRKRMNVLLKQYYQEMMVKEFVKYEIVDKIEISPEEIKNYYNSHLDEFIIPEKIRMYEIVVNTRDKAENILNRLILGEDFEMIAKNESITASKDKNGDMGWIEIEKLDPDVASLVTQLNPGQILGKVIKTNVGYHIIKVEGIISKRIQSLEESTFSVEEMLISQKKRKEVEKFIKTLRSKSKIQLFTENLKLLKENLQ